MYFPIFKKYHRAAFLSKAGITASAMLLSSCHGCHCRCLRCCPHHCSCCRREHFQRRRRHRYRCEKQRAKQRSLGQYRREKKSKICQKTISNLYLPCLFSILYLKVCCRSSIGSLPLRLSPSRHHQISRKK